MRGTATTPSRTPHLLALRVVAAGEGHDLVVPGDVPVVDLLGELTGDRGLHRALGSASGGGLVRADGRVLDPGLALREQGVVDGSVLVLVPGADRRRRGEVDDAVDDAVAAVETVRARSDARSGTCTGPVPGAPLLVAWLSVLAAGVLAVAPRAGVSPAGVPALVLAVAVGAAGSLTARRHTDLPTGLTALAGAGLVATVVVLREPGPPSSALARLGMLLGLLAIGILVAVPRRADVALAPTVAGLLTLGAGAALAWLPVTATQVAVTVLAVAVLSARAAPWVAVAAVGLDRVSEVAPAGRHRPGSPGGVDLDELQRAVAVVRRSVQAATWGLGAVAAAAAGVVAASGHGGLVLAGVLALLLITSQTSTGAAPVPRSAGTLTGGAALGSALLSAAATRVDAAEVLVAPLAVLVVLVVLVPLAVTPHAAQGRGARRRSSSAPRWGPGLRTTLERVALLAVPPLVACGLGLLPTPWGLP